MRCGAIKYCCWVDVGISVCGRDDSEVALVTYPEAAWDGSTIGADLFFVVAREFQCFVLLGFMLAWCAGSNP